MELGGEGEGGVGVTSARGYGGIQGCHLLCLVLGSGGEGVLQEVLQPDCALLLHV